MSDTQAETTGSTQSENGAACQGLDVDQIGKALDGWRSKIDELLVQLDLGQLDLRDEIRTRLDTTQNVYLAARSRLSDARQDAGANVNSLRTALEKLLHDLEAAYEAAEAVVRRSRQQS
jgi:hypothetical protein